MTFKEWIQEQAHREDAVGWFAKWATHKGQGRLNVEADDYSEWIRMVETKAAKMHKLAAKSALLTAWREWKNGGIQGSVETLVLEEEKPTMTVVSTVGRLLREVSGYHEHASEEEDEKLTVTRFHGPVAHVGVKSRLTTNLGNYESATVEYSLVLPCYLEEIDDAVQFADGWVNARVEHEVNRLHGKEPKIPDEPEPELTEEEKELESQGVDTRKLRQEAEHEERQQDASAEGDDGSEPRLEGESAPLESETQDPEEDGYFF